MKKIIPAALAFIGMCVSGSPRVAAQDPSSQSAAAAHVNAEALTNQQFALLLKDIRSIKKQVIAANLTLTDSEATKFWPVYEQYSTDFAKINDTRAALVKEYSEVYGTQTDEQADSLVRRWLDLFSTGPPHQHDDRRATHVATPLGAEPGLILPAEIGT